MLQLQVGAKIGPYRLVQNPSASGTGSIAVPLGKGGTAHVYLVEQTIAPKLAIKRALKLFLPSDKVERRRKEAGHTPGRQNFLQEIASTSLYTHQNLVKIIDAGTYRNNRPYFVMEYVDGPTLQEVLTSSNEYHDKWKKLAHNDPFLILRMAQQISWPVGYLHTNRFFHFDIAPKNIFLREVNERPHLLLGDLGVGRHVPYPTEVANRDLDILVPIAGTKKYTPSMLLPYLEQAWIPLKTLAIYAEFWDVFAIAKVVEAMISGWGLNDSPDLEATQILCKRLSQYEENVSSALASTALERLLPTHVLTAGVEELSTDAFGKRRYVNLPLYPAPISRRVEAIINHPMFTRLQLVPQLFLVRSVLPGGVHTLYEHVLGSFGLALRALTKLLSIPKFRATFSKKELEEAIVSVLIYRIASFPFDRIFLSVCDDAGANVTKPELLELFLDRRINGATLSDVICDNFPSIDMTIIRKIVCDPIDTLEPYQKLIRSLLQSSIDVRVMDYLVRDSYHSGIPAGMGIDVNNIIENLAWTESNQSIGITRLGVFSLEHMLCARYWMFSRVYWNQQSRATISMLRHLIYWIQKGNVSRRSFIRSMMDVDEPGALRKLSELWDISAPYEYTDESILRLLQQPRPRPYRTVAELFGKNWTIDQMKQTETLNAGQLENLRDEYLSNSEFKTLLLPASILFDVPRETPLKLGEDVFVLVDGRDEEPLVAASGIAEVLPSTFLQSAVRLRVFCHPDTDPKLQEKIGLEVREFLNNKFTAA